MDNKFIGLIAIFFLVSGIFLSVLFFNDSLTTFTRAREELVPDQSKSILLAYPLTVKADGSDFATITVWVRNSNGSSIVNQKVTLSATNATLDKTILNTDEAGKAVFKVTSTSASVSEITALINDSIHTNNDVSINFVSPVGN